MKLVAESFPWTRDSHFVYSKDNHTSVLGIREVAQSQRASIQPIIAPTLEGTGSLQEGLASKAILQSRSEREGQSTPPSQLYELAPDAHHVKARRAPCQEYG